MTRTLKQMVLPLGALLVLAGCSGEDATQNCSVNENGDGSYEIVCPDATVTVRDGADGTAGRDGEDGISCTVDEDETGAQVITCEDGSQAVVTDGSDGATGLNALVRMESLAAGAEDCPDGGVAVKEGLDADGDGTLDADEVDTTTVVCNGAPGADGQDGGTLTFEVTPVPTGAACYAGGFRIDVGHDADGDGLEDGEYVGDPEYVCHGVDCTVTDNADGSATLSCQDGSEVTITDGVDGSSCSVRNDGAGVTTISCDDGTSATVRDGAKGEKGDSCTVTDNGDGTYLIACEDGTSVTVSDGQPGAPGTDGTDGTDGESCTVTDNGDGTKTITCATGSVVVADGRDGADGTDGVSALVELLDEPAGESCPYGGTKVVAGLDADADGLLDETEITETSYVCSGQPYAGPLEVEFLGFEGVRAEERSLVSVFSQVEPTFDGDAPLRWELVLRDADGNPVEGARAYYQGASASGDHTQWDAFIETDADGTAAFGPAAGFTAVDAGLFVGTTTDFSLVLPAPGVYELALTLKRLDAGIAVDGDAHVFQALEPTLALDFHAFQDLREGEQNRIGITAEAASDLDPATSVLWRLTLTDADGLPVEGAEATSVTDPAWTIVTDASGQTFYGPSTGFPLADLQGAPVNTQFDLGVAAGSYTLTVELLDVDAGTVLDGGSVAFDVAEPVLTLDFQDFQGLREGEQNRVAITAEAAGDLEATTSVLWRMTLTDAAGTPVEGAEATSVTDPAWTIVTDANGQTTYGPATGFPLGTLQGAPVTTAFDLALGHGDYVLTLELLDLDAGTVLEGDSVAFSVAEPFLAVTTTGFADVVAGTRSLVTVSAVLASDLDGAAPVRWYLTLLDADGLPVAGAVAYYPELTLGDDPNAPATWTRFIETDANGEAAFGPAGGFPASDVQAGVTTGFDLVVTGAGVYALSFELVDVDTGAVLGEASETLTVSPAPAP